MEINEQLLRKYIFHSQILNEHIECVAETYLEGAYDNEEEFENDLKYTTKRINKLKEIEKEILDEINR